MKKKLTNRIAVSRLDVVMVLKQLKRVSATTSLLAAIFLSRIVSAQEVNLDRGVVEFDSINTVLTLGGRIEHNNYWSSPKGSLNIGRIPTSSRSEGRELTSNFRESRLWLKSRSMTNFGQLNTLVEVDLNGASNNSHKFRLRHAMIQLGGITVGQTWSTFQSFVSPDTLSFAAHDTAIRQPLLRWSKESDTVSYDIAIEEARTTLTDSSGGRVLSADDQRPDLVGRVRYNSGWGRAAGALIVRQISQDRVALSDQSTILKNRDQKSAWGINLSSLLYVKEQDDLRLGFIHGDGVGRYLAFNNYNAGAVDNQGAIDIQTSTGGYAAYRHWWTDRLRSNIAYSVAQTDSPLDVVPASVDKRTHSYHVNLFWNPIPDSQVGIEYAYQKRKQENHQEADGYRLYVQIRYGF